ncbi:MAG: metallophosphoesterase [Verrucomicrobiae bacterium]|nr:metallophosphoesterase [Verrucomicrobiae bacterium]
MSTSPTSIVWLSDLHLEFLQAAEVDRFLAKVCLAAPRAVLLSGDISGARWLREHLSLLADRISVPIYFVLGNHDYYGGAFATVDEMVMGLCAKKQNLHWLNKEGAVPLSERTGLVGHAGWGDGMAGLGRKSPVSLNDFIQIRDLREVDRSAMFDILHERGKAAATHLRTVLPSTLKKFDRVFILIHPPPFPDASRHAGLRSDSDHLPHFCRHPYSVRNANDEGLMSARSPSSSGERPPPTNADGADKRLCTEPIFGEPILLVTVVRMKRFSEMLLGTGATERKPPGRC